MQTSNEALFERARQVMPGGVSSPVRAFGSVGGNPKFAASAKGAWISDAEGKKYVDLVGSWGPMIFGHAHPQIVAAAAEALGASSSFGAPCLPELLLAEKIVETLPCVERVRFTSSGTEAVMSAVRVARGVTGKDKIIKFAGCYHGHSDSLLAEAGSGIATLGIPGTPGVTVATAADTIVAEYGNIAQARDIFAANDGQIACVVVEPVPANMGVIEPPAGFNRELAKLCQENQALFIVDEVLTGFRLSKTGYLGIDDTFTPDLVTFGKIVGGGFPLSALGGRAELMDQLAPAGPIYQAGTLSGNPVAAAAGLATLKLLNDDVYRTLNERADQIMKLASDALNAASVAHTINRVNSLFSIFFTDIKVRNYQDAKTQNQEVFARFFHTLLDEGVWLAPSCFEAWFVSTAIGDLELEVIEKALAKAAIAAAKR